MSEKKFRFVSPGVFIEEIDRSRLEATSLRRGPVIIGRAEHGPAMRPTKVSTFGDFVQTFGAPIPGGRGGDVWRTGNYTSPTYASYAAQAYLRNNAPVNFIRLVGVKHDSATPDGGTPGWKYTSHAAGTGGGAQGLFVFDSGSAVSSPGTLAAIWYFQDTSAGLNLTGTLAGGTATTASMAHVIKSTDNSHGFTGQFYGIENSEKVSFNFDRNSDRFIRKVFNTNPTLTNTASLADADEKQYFLGETFEGTLGTILNSASLGSVYGVMLPLKTPLGAATTADGANFKQDSATSKSGWVFSQDTNSDKATFDTRLSNGSVPKLFRFESLSRGDWAARNLKISIRDISFPRNNFDKYGTFTIIVRSSNDTDAEPGVYERFENLNLNPESANYIARRIGDKYATWDENSRRLKEHGLYDNVSKFIRVDVHASIQDGGAEGLLPAGFYGPNRFGSFTVNSGSVAPSITATFVTGGFGAKGGTARFFEAAPGCDFTASIQFPKIRLRANSDDSTLSSPTDAYFGIDTRQDGSGRVFDQTYYDLVRSKPASVDNHDADNLTSASFSFSLDDLSASWGHTATEYDIKAVYAAGNRAGSKSITGEGLTGSYKGPSAEVGSFSLLLDLGYDKFTMPLYGGFNGFDVKEREPLGNHLISADDTDTGNYVFNTYRRAIDMVADSENLDCNLATVPGLKAASLTERLVTNCEERGDVLAIIDIQNDYTPKYERSGGSLNEQDNVGNIDNAVTTLKARNLNSSYGCAYYPWVLVRDTATTGQSIWMPPSVVALGVMGNSEIQSELWFAPAGFNRGGLSTGAAGLNVVGVRQKLSAKERDKLYDQNVNPIASFPSEGIVVFGQKTLQVTDSALDRINVRRLLIFLKKEISFAASRVLFDQNVPATWARFTASVEPLLASVRARFGLTDYRLVLDEDTTTAELVDRNIMYAKLFLKPARAIEYIALDFVVTATGASFDE